MLFAVVNIQAYSDFTDFNRFFLKSGIPNLCFLGLILG